MTTTTGPSPSSPTGLELKVEDALSGVQTVLAAKSTLQLNGGAMTQAQIAAQLNGFLTTANAVDTAKQSYAAAVSARKTAEPPIREFLVQLRGALVGLFGRDNPQLAKFGMSASKPSKQSPTTAVLAAAQRQLTRAQRGTIGPKARSLITVVSPPQVTMGGSGKATVLPPTVNAPAGSAASSPASGQVSAAVQPASAVAQPAAVAAQPTIASPIGVPLGK